jgi:glycosyltransferase involved in cell wall biosynthesis
MPVDIYENKNNLAKLNISECELLYSHEGYVKDPLFSIIITVYKRKKCLYDAINSALTQNAVRFDYEIIIINDDPQGDFTHIDKYYDIRNISFYRNKKNLGLFNNLNMGALLAKGKYIVYLHDDDLLYPEYLSAIYSLLKTSKDIKCILVNRDIIKPDGNNVTPNRKFAYRVFLFFCLLPLMPIRIFFRKSYKKIVFKNGLFFLLNNLYKAPSCGTLFEKESFIRLGGYDDTYYPVSDYFFFLKFNRLYTIYMLRKKLSCYRWIENLSQKKEVQLTGLNLLNEFYKSKQPVSSINTYYRIFHNEIFYAKYLMVDNQYRDEIKNNYIEIREFNKWKWFLFRFVNMAYKYINDFV